MSHLLALRSADDVTIDWRWRHNDPDHCDANTWQMISNSLDIDFIHGDSPHMMLKRQSSHTDSASHWLYRRCAADVAMDYMATLRDPIIVTWPHNCDTGTWKVIANPLESDWIIHGHIHDRSCKKVIHNNLVNHNTISHMVWHLQ